MNQGEGDKGIRLNALEHALALLKGQTLPGTSVCEIEDHGVNLPRAFLKALTRLKGEMLLWLKPLIRNLFGRWHRLASVSSGLARLRERVNL